MSKKNVRFASVQFFEENGEEFFEPIKGERPKGEEDVLEQGMSEESIKKRLEQSAGKASEARQAAVNFHELIENSETLERFINSNQKKQDQVSAVDPSTTSSASPQTPSANPQNKGLSQASKAKRSLGKLKEL